MATPTGATWPAPEIAGDIERYFQSATLMGHDRVRLFRLAWDLACSSFAGRQVLYERFFAGIQRAAGRSVQQLRSCGRGGAREGPLERSAGRRVPS